jgi:hypothetical protein
VNPFKAIWKIIRKADVIVKKADDILDAANVIALMTPTHVDDLVLGIARRYSDLWDEVRYVLNKFTPDELKRQVHFVFVLVGLAFGPEGMKHFSQLSPAEQIGMLEMAPILRTNHTDWPKPLEWVPRTATTWTLPDTWPILAGNTSDLKPIPDRGKWYVKRGYLAFTTEQGIHGRLGFRFDDIDQYVTFPSATLKKIG